jgi:hypothetical protein
MLFLMPIVNSKTERIAMITQMIAIAIVNQINVISASVLSSPLGLPPPITKPDSLKGIDDLIHAEFEAYRATCFNWLLAATGLVIVGLIWEGPELWYEITAIVRHWRFSRKFHFSLPENPVPPKAKLAAFVGWLFIVVGVAGEYVADSFVSKADGYVLTFDEILLNEAQRGTAFARERASAAYERASENEKETAETLKQAEQERADAAKSLASAESTRKEVEGFALQISEANERAANATAQAAESNKIAEQEKLARLQLEVRLAPRTLTMAQQKQVTDGFRASGIRDLDVFLYGDTPEIVRILVQLRDAIAASGCNVRVWSVVGGNMAVWGILVDTVTGADSAVDASASMAVSTLSAAGLAASRSDPFPPGNSPGIINGPPWDAKKEAPIRMLIGSKE